MDGGLKVVGFVVAPHADNVRWIVRVLRRPGLATFAPPTVTVLVVSAIGDTAATIPPPCHEQPEREERCRHHKCPAPVINDNVLCWQRDGHPGDFNRAQFIDADEESRVDHHVAEDRSDQAERARYRRGWFESRQSRRVRTKPPRLQELVHRTKDRSYAQAFQR